MNNAVIFINQVKEKCPQPVYNQFIETLKKHDRQVITVKEMNLQISDLMKPYPDLLEKFKKFLPDLQSQKNEVERN